jgi:hypothetical protein
VILKLIPLPFQAAISIALHHGCEVFTTVGSAEKKAYLKERFPQLADKHFSNSRTTEFASHIMKATKGKGINLRITCEIYSIMYIMITTGTVAAPSNDQLSGTDQRNFLLTSTVVASPFNDNVVSLIAVGLSNVRSYEILGLKPIIWLTTYCKYLISLLLSTIFQLYHGGQFY